MALTKVQTIGIETGISLTGVTTVTTLNASTDTLSVGGTVNFGGNVSIAGTLTYEDVTNIDSVGIITARSGVKFGASGTTVFGNSTGIGIGEASPTRKLVVAGDTNTVAVVRGATNGTSSLFLGDSDDEDIGALTYNHPSNYLAITVNTSERLRIDSSGDYLFLGGTLRIKNAANDAQRGAIYGDDSSFHINAGVNNLIAYSAGTERLRIDSSGQVILNNSASSGDATVLRITGGTNGSSVIEMGDTADTDIGQIAYYQSSNAMAFRVNASEVARIDSSGRLLVNHTADTAPQGYASKLQLCDTSYQGSSLLLRRDGGASGPVLLFTKSRGTTKGANTVVQDGDNLGTLRWFAADGTDSESEAAQIRAQIDGTPGSNDVPGRLTFSTTADGASSVTERMRIDSSGRLLAGTTSSSGNFRAVFQGNAGNNSAGGDIVLARGAATPANAQALGLLGFSDNTHTISAVIQCNRDGGTWSSSSKPTLMAFQTCADSSSTPTERMRITKDGYLRFGQSSADTPGYGNSTTGISMLPDGRIFSSMGGTFSQFNRNSNGTVVSFARSSTGVGQISVTTSATTYGTSSDYRLKENVVALDGAIARVKQLLPKRFNFIVDNTKTVDGFIAHEAQTVVPEAVTGTHNEVDDDNNPVYQSIDTSKLVPLLTAALQEAISKIETLETKVAALEG